MIEYMNPNVTANTIRLVEGLGGLDVALVEDPSDVTRLQGRMELNLYLISAPNSAHFVETVKILHGQNWRISFTSAKDLIYSAAEKLEVLGTPNFKATSDIEHKPTLIGLTSSSAPPSWLKELHEITDSAVITDSPMNRQFQDWSAKNSRRVLLIRKKYRQGLTNSEQNELSNLRTAMRMRLNANHPISFQALDAIDQYLEDAERRTKKR